MPELESLQPNFDALLAEFQHAVRQRLAVFPEIEDAVPVPAEVQLALELSYVLSNLEAEMPQALPEASVFSSILRRLMLYARNQGAMLENEWRILAQDAATFSDSPFAQAASLAAMSMCMLLYCDTDKSNNFATATCLTAAQKIPDHNLPPLIRYGWGELGFRIPIPAPWRQVLEEKARA